MSQFDVYANATGEGFLVDCQTDLLAHLNTRLVAPLWPEARAPKPAGRLNPRFDLDGDCHVMVTQYAAAVEVRQLGPKITSLAEHSREIISALDVLLTGV